MLILLSWKLKSGYLHITHNYGLKSSNYWHSKNVLSFYRLEKCKENALWIIKISFSWVSLKFTTMKFVKVRVSFTYCSRKQALLF